MTKGDVGLCGHPRQQERAEAVTVVGEPFHALVRDPDEIAHEALLIVEAAGLERDHGGVVERDLRRVEGLGIVRRRFPRRGHGRQSVVQFPKRLVDGAPRREQSGKVEPGVAPLDLHLRKRFQEGDRSPGGGLGLRHAPRAPEESALRHHRPEAPPGEVATGKLGRSDRGDRLLDESLAEKGILEFLESREDLREPLEAAEPESQSTHAIGLDRPPGIPVAQFAERVTVGGVERRLPGDHPCSGHVGESGERLPGHVEGDGDLLVGPAKLDDVVDRADDRGDDREDAGKARDGGEWLASDEGREPFGE